MKKYSLVVASNFLDHYMYELCIELKKYFNDFYFIASEKLDTKYSNLGFNDLNNSDFVIKAYEDEDKALQLIMDSDIVITGSYKYQKHLYKRKKVNKIIVYYSERLFKYNKILNLISLLYNKYKHRFDNNDVLLCVSAYAAEDYYKCGLFNNKAYKFGYFPKKYEYDDIDNFVESKNKNSIIWVGRLIDWKHPEYAVMIAKRLKQEGYSFNINIVGNGPKENELQKMIIDFDLNDCVHLLGGMSPEKVREKMKESQIYLFTSNSGEGWGVVLNEAMNSACACVASNSAGSVPYLVNNNTNGLIYYEDDFEELYLNVKKIFNNNELGKTIAINAYNTIINDWNSSIAAQRFSAFIDEYINGNSVDKLFADGILSKAHK